MFVRTAALLPSLSLFGCAGSAVDDSGPLARCETTDCFYERDIRDFEVVDRSTIVVYVGQQRCPFVVELDGLACDIAFTPQIQFLQGAFGRIDQATGLSSGQVCHTSRNLYVYAGILDPRFDPTTGIGSPGAITRPTRPGGQGGFGDTIRIDPTAGDVCRVEQVRSINDDQLLELYANEGVMPPPPPIGAGELEVPENADEGTSPSPQQSGEPDEQGTSGASDAESSEPSGQP